MDRTEAAMKSLKSSIERFAKEANRIARESGFTGLSLDTIDESIENLESAIHAERSDADARVLITALAHV